MIFKHDPEYVAQFGRCVYGFLSVEWVVIELLLRYSDLKMDVVGSFDSGRIDTEFTEAMRGRDDPTGLASRYHDLVWRRNDILHARPATVEGKQRLYRWDVLRGKVGPITDETLAMFLADCERLSRDLNTERQGRGLKRPEAEPRTG